MRRGCALLRYGVGGRRVRGYADPEAHVRDVRPEGLRPQLGQALLRRPRPTATVLQGLSLLEALLCSASARSLPPQDQRHKEEGDPWRGEPGISLDGATVSAAADYKKKPNVFAVRSPSGEEFLFQVTSPSLHRTCKTSQTQRQTIFSDLEGTQRVGVGVKLPMST